MKKIFIPFLMILFFAACTMDKKENVELANVSGYPTEVGKILINKCATAGCHNTQSCEAAAGIDYSTWDNIFLRGFNANSVIPYSTNYSYCLYFVNTDPGQGLALQPTMPQNGTPLSPAEYATLKNWIANGAPNDQGFVKFSDDPNRKKFYVCMQGSDQVAVFDAVSGMIMRYVQVGVNSSSIEAPHQVKVTPDGKYWCVVFYSGDVLQIFNTSDDKLVRSVNIGSGQWNTVCFTPDSKTAYCSSTEPSNAKIAPVDLTTFTHNSDMGGVSSPHGSHVTKDGNFLYVTSQYGNFINKITLTNNVPPHGKGDIDPIQIKTNSPNADPHEIAFTPDESRYFISCQSTNEVRVFDTSTDTLIAVLPVGTYPQELAFSQAHKYVFVTCTQDDIDLFSKGSVYIFDYETLQPVTTGQSIGIGKIYPGYQPHGIAVDDDHNVVYVSNLNVNTSGPPPHHPSSSGGRNGWISIIDMSTMDLLQVPYPSGNKYVYKTEVLPSPYFVAYRK